MITAQPRHPLDINRDQLSGQVEQYLAGGGLIQLIPIGISGERDASIWTKGKMVVSDAPKPERIPKQQPRPGAASMKAANQGKQMKAAQARRILAPSVRECADQGMTISATAESLGITRVHVRKIAAEHSIVFGKEAPCST